MTEKVCSRDGVLAKTSFKSKKKVLIEGTISEEIEKRQNKKKLSLKVCLKLI